MLRDLVAQYGPLLVFANVLAAAIGLPVPAMPTLVLFGAMAAMHPAMIGSQLATVIALSVLGALLGDTVWYVAGRRYGGATLKTICRLSLSRDTCVKKTERFFGRYGVRVLAVARFIPGLSLVSVPMAGALHTRYRTFVGPSSATTRSAPRSGRSPASSRGSCSIGKSTGCSRARAASVMRCWS